MWCLGLEAGDEVAIQPALIQSPSIGEVPHGISGQCVSFLNVQNPTCISGPSLATKLTRDHKSHSKAKRLLWFHHKYCLPPKRNRDNCNLWLSPDIKTSNSTTPHLNPSPIDFIGNKVSIFCCVHVSTWPARYASMTRFEILNCFRCGWMKSSL